ncbi:MAG TPA: Hint domain-containing protein [Candidatus Dormibacteraeota bacterium]|nr:Hint domain-containing protein [Candidatus Dormibacteraeota bacterium]
MAISLRCLVVLRVMAAGLALCCLVGCSLIAGLSKLAIPAASAKLMFACLPSSACIDTPSGPRGIEKLEPGDSVTGFDGKPVRILQKHSYLEQTGTEFLRITFSDGPSIELCGMHRVAGTRARLLKVGQTIDGRVVASIQSRFGETHSYDLLTEDAGYRIGGVRVNSMIEEMQTVAVSGLRSVRD